MHVQTYIPWLKGHNLHFWPKTSMDGISPSNIVRYIYKTYYNHQRMPARILLLVITARAHKGITKAWTTCMSAWWFQNTSTETDSTEREKRCHQRKSWSHQYFSIAKYKTNAGIRFGERWLTVIPISEMGFNLNKREFRDASKLRYH